MVDGWFRFGGFVLNGRNAMVGWLVMVMYRADSREGKEGGREEGRGGRKEVRFFSACFFPALPYA